MGCIEIETIHYIHTLWKRLNNNMGCIEISFRDEDEIEKVVE